MPENTPQIRHNLGRNPIKASRTRISTMALRHFKKSEERQSTLHSLRTVGLGVLMLVLTAAIVVAMHYVGRFGAEYGRHIAMTRATKHDVNIGHAMAITGGFGVLWMIGGVLIAFVIACLAVVCFIPKRTFRLSLFGYYRDEDGQELIGELLTQAIVAAIYAAIVVAVNFAAMGLLTDMVRLTH